MSQLITKEDYEFLNENFTRYGLAWEGGLDMLENFFTADIVKSRTAFEINLSTRNIFSLKYKIKIGLKNGDMSFNKPELPDGAELNKSELDRVNEILKSYGELWLLEPLNSRCRLVNLADGIGSLYDKKDIMNMATRLIGDKALIFIVEGTFSTEYFCISIDLKNCDIDEVRWISLPPDKGNWLTKSEAEFIDKSLRRYGDFGVYGNVTSGLRDIAENFELRIRDKKDLYYFSVSPFDGHGHYLHFLMDKTAGKISDVTAGHMKV